MKQIINKSIETTGNITKR